MATTAVAFTNLFMTWYWWLFGIVSVVGFFYFSNKLTKQWATIREKTFEHNLFWYTFILRIAVMLFLYWFHDTMTGQPFMFHTSDSIEYSHEAEWMAQTIRDGNFSDYINYKFVQRNGISDAGYPMYLGFVYLLSDDSIIVARLLKCLWSALSCVLIYRLGKRNFGESVGRMASILMMLEPHFSIYAGFHLKETEMIFLMMLFLERADALLRHRNFSFKTVSVVVVLMAVLFTFRTVLGLTAVFSVAMALLLSSKRVMGWGKRIVILIVVGLSALYFAGGRIMTEVEQIWELKDQNQDARMSVITKTQTLAKYAGAAVFAPMIFTIPFPTMVETPNQETSRMLHGAMFVKNIMSYFCIMAIISLLFPLIPGFNKWRDHVLIEVFLIAYLVILVFSAFAHADRFHMPALALEILFMAYGVSLSRIPQLQRWYKYWVALMFIAVVAWNWFKLSGRGMV
jgi:4-amino-4-deoxy-L-arabinose transferase-like glycosyltransferase